MHCHISQLLQYSFSRLLYILKSIKNKNLNQNFIRYEKIVSKLRIKKKLILLSQKLVKREIEEAARFFTNANIINKKISKKLYICQKIIQESKLNIFFIKAYSSLNDAQYQTFIRVCKHVFQKKLTTYYKKFDKVLYKIIALEKNLSNT